MSEGNLEFGDLIASLQDLFIHTRLLDISVTLHEAFRYEASLKNNPHVILIGFSDDSLHFLHCNGRRIIPISALNLASAIEAIVNLVYYHKCCKCLSDFSVSSNSVYYTCSHCKLSLCVGCHPVAEVGQICPCGHGPLACSYEIVPPCHIVSLKAHKTRWRDRLLGVFVF